jgi:transaldolase
MSKNPLRELPELGQSVWLDRIRRSHILSGALLKLIEEDELRGETSNPTIFEKAITGSDDYAADLAKPASQGKTALEVYERLATDDVRMAADVFRPVYEATDAVDGYISIEVSPKLAFDTQGTVDDARRLWGIVDRPNLMVKIPGTPAGVAAVEQCLYEGLNVNITLLFSLEAYEQVAWAYIKALERRTEAGRPLAGIASVASFFVSRIDVLADRLLEECAQGETDPERRAALIGLQGRLAIANAKLAYVRFREIFGSDRFRALAAKGARVQRPLWASTSTKNPRYRDVVYVEELIGPDTVNTMPQETLNAFHEHGQVANTLEANVDEAREAICQFESFGFSFGEVTRTVLEEGVAKFEQSFDNLLAKLALQLAIVDKATDRV